MSAIPLTDFSSQIADLVSAAAPSVVQVQGRTRPASGIVFRPDLVVTTRRALGQEEGLKVRIDDGTVRDADFRGWDPATGIAVLRVASGGLTPIPQTATAVRTGHLAFGVARSWSNVVTATAGIVAVIGGPLPTGPGRSIARVVRTTAPMHGGFAGGAVLDASGACMGLATAAAIRGLSVTIPHDIVWETAERLVERGTPRRGYLGVAGQPVRLAERQHGQEGPTHGLLVAAVSPGSPAEAAGLFVGDVILSANGIAVRSPFDLLALLDDRDAGHVLHLGVLRGDVATDVAVTVGTRPTA